MGIPSPCPIPQFAAAPTMPGRPFFSQGGRWEEPPLWGTHSTQLPCPWPVMPVPIEPANWVRLGRTEVERAGEEVGPAWGQRLPSEERQDDGATKNLGPRGPCHPNSGSHCPKLGPMGTQPLSWAIEETNYKNTVGQGWSLPSPTLVPLPITQLRCQRATDTGIKPQGHPFLAV